MSEVIRLEPTPGVRVWRYGSGGRALVCLPGWGGHHRTFEPLSFMRPKDTSMFVFDLPGFGESAPPAAWEMEPYARGLLAAIDGLGLETYDLAGNCAGGVVAMEAALHARGRARRLMLVDPFAFVPWYFRLLTAPVVGRFFYLSTFANPLGRIATNLALRKKRREQTDLAAGFRDVNHGTSHRFLTMLCASTDLERYREIHLSVDIVYGETTFEAVRRSVALLEALWPERTHTRRIDGAGHLPIAEAPSNVAEVLFATHDLARCRRPETTGRQPA